jgi:hypothetical protein
MPNHEETGLDPMIQSQITGSQRALEVRTELSRLRKKSPAIPIQNSRRATMFIFCYLLQFTFCDQASHDEVRAKLIEMIIIVHHRDFLRLVGILETTIDAAKLLV